MGADIKSLRTRIRSVDSTLHLTKAMGLVAASKIRKATRVMNQSREYAAAMDDVVSVLRSSPECERTPYMQPAGEGTRLIVIAGDRGLAGGGTSISQEGRDFNCENCKLRIVRARRRYTLRVMK